MQTLDSIEKYLNFLTEIGVPYSLEAIDTDAVNPGIIIRDGGLVIDLSKLRNPGDILHDAGHIAIVPAAERGKLSDDMIEARPDFQSEEMATIAWSYAACIYLALDPFTVFHDHGYRGGGGYIAENFAQGRYFGVSTLQWFGMTHERPPSAVPGASLFPTMLKWLRD